MKYYVISNKIIRGGRGGGGDGEIKEGVTKGCKGKRNDGERMEEGLGAGWEGESRGGGKGGGRMGGEEKGWRKGRVSGERDGERRGG